MQPPQNTYLRDSPGSSRLPRHTFEQTPPINNGINKSNMNVKNSPASGRKSGSGSRYSPQISPKSVTSPKSISSSKSLRNKQNQPNSSSRDSRVSSNQPSQAKQEQVGGEEGQKDAAVVTPELLVDALSGHEDGLLAIAERLMEHYEGGYDVMGEAIIDAFADVQKLFQHVVEAAHMEGAAFEASRREKEDRNNKDTGIPGGDNQKDDGPDAAQGITNRHDEFIDDDVRDALVKAIREGQAKKDAGQFMECYELYEEACNSASALLPVDSDHRGRLQLSIARAESMSPERACAILRYSMDDVLRSGNSIRSHKNPDPSKRGDCVLKPSKHNPSTQSSQEALASLVEEMKEVLSAPVYSNTPVQDVADRFWEGLSNAQKESSKKEERLENNLGELKGEFLLARAEWEEKLNEEMKSTETYRKKYESLKNHLDSNQFMDQARQTASQIGRKTQTTINNYPPFESGAGLCNSMSNHMENISPSSKGLDSSRRSHNTPSVSSFGSALGQHARSLVGSFGCYGMGNVSGDDSKKKGNPPSVVSSSNSTDDESARPLRKFSRSKNSGAGAVRW